MVVVGLILVVVLDIIIAVYITRSLTKSVLATVDAVSTAARGDFTHSIETPST